jgi:hypothetical protein
MPLDVPKPVLSAITSAVDAAMMDRLALFRR